MLHLFLEHESILGLSLHNPIKFESACGIPEFTNYTDLFKGCLDYIFYQTDFLKIDQVNNFYCNFFLYYQSIWINNKIKLMLIY